MKRELIAPPKITDISGKVARLGDVIAFSGHKYSSLKVGIVTAFTPTMMIVNRFNYEMLNNPDVINMKKRFGYNFYYSEKKVGVDFIIIDRVVLN